MNTKTRVSEVVRVPEVIETETQTDYIMHGSPGHANFLMIRKAEEGDDPTFKGYALMDSTPYQGRHDAPGYALSVLKGKVGELLAGAPKVPANAPVMWTAE